LSEPIEPRMSRTLDAVIAKSADEFLAALVEMIVVPWGGNTIRAKELSDYPEAARMVLVLNSLRVRVKAGGMLRFLKVGAASYLDDAERWCAQLGAARTAAYLRAVLAVLPGGHVPREAGERGGSLPHLTSEEIEAIAAIDRDYAGAVDEIPALLLACVLCDRKPIQDWLDAEAQQGPGEAPASLTGVLEMSVAPPHAADGAFMQALSDLLQATPERRKRISSAFHEVPEDVQLATVLYCLWLDASVSGIEKFVAASATGEYVRRAETWCTRIGARRTAAYLRAAIELFPGHEVPRDWEQRQRVSGRLMDALERVDASYKGVVEELPARLRDYLRQSQRAVAEWLAETGAPPETSGDAEDRMTTPLLQFLMDIEQLGHEAWLSVVQRLGEAEPAIREAQGLADDVAAEVVRGHAPGGIEKARWLADKELAMKRWGAVVGALPVSVQVAGGDIRFREGAGVATMCAAMGLGVYDALVRTPEGRETLRTLLRPFDGWITPLPAQE